MASEPMVTDADRKAAADVLDEISALLDHVGIGQVADLIRDGEYDEHDVMPYFIAHRQAALIEGVRLGIEAGAPAMQAVQCPFDDHATAHAYERGMLDALAAIRALSPEAIAARAVEKPHG